jgi:uncharacterized membrane protein YecN with MAPEG domain
VAVHLTPMMCATWGSSLLTTLSLLVLAFSFLLLCARRQPRVWHGPVSA